MGVFFFCLGFVVLKSRTNLKQPSGEVAVMYSRWCSPTDLLGRYTDRRRLQMHLGKVWVQNAVAGWNSLWNRNGNGGLGVN